MRADRARNNHHFRLPNAVGGPWWRRHLHGAVRGLAGYGTGWPFDRAQDERPALRDQWGSIATLACPPDGRQQNVGGSEQQKRPEDDAKKKTGQ